MTDLRSLGVEPNAYAQFIPSTIFANAPGGVRILALVGTGITSAMVLGEEVTKGSLDGQDALDFPAVALPSTITDQNFVVYTYGTDYQLTGGEVDWSLDNPATITGSVAATTFNIGAQTLQVSVNGTLQTVTFSGVTNGATSISSVVSQISGAGLSFTASNIGNQVQITTGPTNNTTIQIGNGTANATLGFTPGTASQSSQEPSPGITYTLDYSRAKVTGPNGDYVPTLYFDLPSVMAAYGSPSPANSISLAAYLAFQNGASVVMGMQVDPNVDSTLGVVGFRNAIDKLQTVDCNIVVPLSTNTLVLNYVGQHVTFMSSLIEQRFRTGLVGLGVSAQMADAQSLAAGLHSRRMAVVWPQSETITLSDGTVITTDGSYMAAAIGGIRVNPIYDVAEPLLRKQVVGFTTIADTLNRTQKNILANAGVMIVENQNGVPRVRDGLTTDLTTADSAEYSVTEIIDFVAESTSSFLGAAFIGTKFLNETPGLVQVALNQILSTFVENEILNDFTNIQVIRNAQDPTQLDVRFQIAPIFPVKFILITFTI